MSTRRFIDLHLHLLPNVDDGCQTLDDSLSLAKTLLELGFSEAAPSPHNRPEYAPKAVCLERLAELRAAFVKADIDLILHENSENFFLDESLLTAVKTDAFRPIGSTGKYMLIEAPYQTTLPKLTDIVFRLKVKGITPVIAHPERCVEFERKGRAAEVTAAGALLQLDVGALIGRYGRTAEQLAKTFLDEDLYAIAATDAHSPVKAGEWLSKSFAALQKAVGETRVEQMLSVNPRCILQGLPIER
jgi:protein-tyrosine phosphatase